MPEGTEAFMNQAISFETTVPPEDLLKVCKWVEHKMGRPAHEPEYAPDGSRIYPSRIIDIDIALYGDRKVDTPELENPSSSGRGEGLCKAPSSPDNVTGKGLRQVHGLHV